MFRSWGQSKVTIFVFLLVIVQSHQRQNKKPSPTITSNEGRVTLLRPFLDLLMMQLLTIPGIKYRYSPQPFFRKYFDQEKCNIGFQPYSCTINMIWYPSVNKRRILLGAALLGPIPCRYSRRYILKTKEKQLLRCVIANIFFIKSKFSHVAVVLVNVNINLITIFRRD